MLPLLYLCNPINQRCKQIHVKEKIITSFSERLLTYGIDLLTNHFSLFNYNNDHIYQNDRLYY